MVHPVSLQTWATKASLHLCPSLCPPLQVQATGRGAAWATNCGSQTGTKLELSWRLYLLYVATFAAGGMEPQLPLFRPFRALGYITDSVPFAVQRRGKESYVIVSVGRSWQVGAGQAAVHDGSTRWQPAEPHLCCLPGLQLWQADPYPCWAPGEQHHEHMSGCMLAKT